MQMPEAHPDISRYLHLMLAAPPGHHRLVVGRQVSEAQGCREGSQIPDGEGLMRPAQRPASEGPVQAGQGSDCD